MAAPQLHAVPAHGLLALFGPTGVGKTEIALEVADRLRASGQRPIAVSADALQVYSGLEVLTGVASAADRARLEHRLVSFIPVDATFSVGQYAQLAHAEIDRLIDDGAVPIVVGGTGLYLRAALAELKLRPMPPAEVRERWEQELAAVGPAGLHAQLARRAPWAADGIEPADRHRVVRALALLDLGELEPPDGPNRLWTAETRRPTRLIALVRDREQLYERIETRVDAMIAAGAVEEVRRAQAAGASDTARKALGFDDLLAGDVDGMKRRTRNFAKRQLTWMRKLAGVEQVDITNLSAAEVAQQIVATPPRPAS